MLLGQLRSATAGPGIHRSRSQAASAVACCAPPLAAPTPIPESRRTQEVVRSPYMLKQPRLLPSSHQHLIIPKEGVSQLFPHRIPTKSLIPGRSLARWWSQDPQANRTAYSSFQVVLAFELDGQILQRKTLVDLRFYPGRHNVRVHNHQAFDLLKDRKLLGWRRDSASQLVAILSSPAGAPPVPAGPAPTPIRIPRSLRRTQQPHKVPQPIGTDLHASVNHWITDLPYADPPPFKEILSLPSPAGMAAAVPAASRGIFSKTPLSIEQQLVQQAAGAPWPHFMQQYVPPLPPMQQQDLPQGRPAPASSPTASSPPAARDRKRTFVPARLRPVMSEVYVPFGLWRDLFDGSDRPFPDKGLALRIAITGVVQMADQPALLVRRVTPYGYYVLRGLKGLASLKGKLMVRWSLLVNGVVELEIGAPESKPPTPALVPVAAGTVRPGGRSGNIVPMAPGMRRLQSSAPPSHSLYM